MRSVVYSRLGARRKQLLVGPGYGLDNAIVKIGSGKVLVSTTDPLSFIPSVGAKDSAWLSIHLIASDLATSGVSPQYALFDFNLPPKMEDSVFSDYWTSIHHECRKLGVSIAGGHTGRYQGCDYTIIGGGSMIALCPEARFLTPAMANAGDDLILTKGAAIETTAVLTRSFPRSVRRALGPRLFERAWEYLRKVSTVKDALAAASVGVRKNGVTAMHDATEGGVLAAIIEVSTASGLGLRLDVEKIRISDESLAVCKLFRVDPLTSLSQGSLVVATRPFATSRVLRALSSQELVPSVVGRFVSKDKGSRMLGSRFERSVGFPRTDQYWEAYSRATAKGWN